ncbi:MAG: hypothetical protein K2N63_17840 [Lachnospiraceae bacterium]|nr:hypothetical protein [Lachnospiraceae bacterium]
MDRLKLFAIPQGVIKSQDFRIRLRTRGGEWQEAEAYSVRVEMHHVSVASYVYFDFSGVVECEITSLRCSVDTVDIRPASRQVHYRRKKDTISFFLSEPAKLSIEINGDRFHNLHLVAGEAKVYLNTLKEDGKRVFLAGGQLSRPEESWAMTVENEEGLGDGISMEGIAVHDPAELSERLRAVGKGAVLYFGAGLHYIKGNIFDVPSHVQIQIEGGAVVLGSFRITNEQYVSISGRGVIYLGYMKKESFLRGVEVNNSAHVLIEGVTILNPTHNIIHLGSVYDIVIEDVRGFSHMGWCVGVNMMACENVLIKDVFLRSSDDCITVYGRRYEYLGDSGNVRVKDCVLWADVAHPTNIGIHGDSGNGGNTIENVLFENIDILEHHEPQDDYLGCLCINAGDGNTIKNVTYKNIRVEQFERGKLLDIQVKWNKRYNPIPGNWVENIRFENIRYTGSGEFTSEIRGFDETRKVVDVRFKDLYVRGKHVTCPEEGNIHIGEFAEKVVFE